MWRRSWCRGKGADLEIRPPVPQRFEESRIDAGRPLVNEHRRLLRGLGISHSLLPPGYPIGPPSPVKTLQPDDFPADTAGSHWLTHIGTRTAGLPGLTTTDSPASRLPRQPPSI